jgi:hypothetical protein
VLGGELEIAAFQPAIRRFVLDPHVGELDSSLGEGEIVLARERFARVVLIDAGRSLTMDVGVVVALELAVENDARDAGSLILQVRTLDLEEPIQLGVMSELARLDDAGVELLLPAV